MRKHMRKEGREGHRREEQKEEKYDKKKETTKKKKIWITESGTKIGHAINTWRGTGVSCVVRTLNKHSINTEYRCSSFTVVVASS